VNSITFIFQVKRYTDSPSSTFGGGKPFLPKEFEIAPAAKVRGEIIYLKN